MIDNPEYRNWAKLEKERAALDDWRYRVMSAMPVASSAIPVLSFAQPLSVPLDTMHRALQRPICSEWEILSMDESRLRIALKISVIFSFAAFAVLAVVLTVCGFLYS